MQGSRFSRLCVFAVLACAGAVSEVADAVRTVVGYARDVLLYAVATIAPDAPVLGRAIPKAPPNLVPKHGYSLSVSSRPTISPSWRMCSSV